MNYKHFSLKHIANIYFVFIIIITTCVSSYSSNAYAKLNKEPQVSQIDADTSDVKPKVGELFMLGFSGTKVPEWMKIFAHKYGLGGVILFDFNMRTKEYKNNIISKKQLKQLCAEIKALPSSPMIFIDQEGGMVRRLKENRGFAPLPSQAKMHNMSVEEQVKIWSASYAEMKEIGIDFVLAPVVDLNINPKNPNIGMLGRSFSSSPNLVINDALTLDKVARKYNIFLALKHYPGIGAANVDSHLDMMNITNVTTFEQRDVFYKLAPQMHGNSILVGHAIIDTIDPGMPATISKPMISLARKHLPIDTLLISDSLQMGGVRSVVDDTIKLAALSINAGINMVCIDNNLRPEEDMMLDVVEHCAQFCQNVNQSIEMVQNLKAKRNKE